MARGSRQRGFESFQLDPDERFAYIFDPDAILFDFGVSTVVGIGVNGIGIAFKGIAKKTALQATEEALEGGANLFDNMSIEDQRRYLAWERARANGITPDNPDAYSRFGYLIDREVEYDNAYFLATLDRNIYDAFDEDQIVRLINKVDEFADTLSNTRRSPAVAGVYNRRTGEFFFGVNHPKGYAPDLVTPLREYFDNMPDDIWKSYNNGTKGVGSHAEIWALNEALQADPSASIDDFLLYVIHGDKKNYGMPFARCPHCQWISQLFYSIYK